MRSEGERRLSGKLPLREDPSVRSEGASVGAPVGSSVKAADRRVESDSDERVGPMNDSESGRSSPPEARASVGALGGRAPARRRTAAEGRPTYLRRRAGSGRWASGHHGLGGTVRMP